MSSSIKDTERASFISTLGLTAVTAATKSNRDLHREVLRTTLVLTPAQAAVLSINDLRIKNSQRAVS